MESVLELQRNAHEDLERFDQIMVTEILKRPRTHKEKIVQELFLKKVLDNIQIKSQSILDMYEDKDGFLAKDIESLTGSAELGEFYRRLKDIKDVGRRAPLDVDDSVESEYQEYKRKLQNDIVTMFSGEEGFGRYLDLHLFYVKFVNLKGYKSSLITGTSNLDYIKFLDLILGLEKIPVIIKSYPDYSGFLEEVLHYIHDFYRRTRPLYNLEEYLANLESEFEKNWQGKKKLALPSEDIFCVACRKFFSKQTVFDSHLSGKKHLKAEKELIADQKSKDYETIKAQETEKIAAKDRSVARLEYFVQNLIKNLDGVWENTKQNVERKQSRSFEEREEDMEEEEELELAEAPEDKEEEDEEVKLYNPLKLPLGWDGKPIPYWLFKLHGLGVEYPCEICGNYVYMGRRAYEKHFTEWRHTYHLKCLGISNSKHFNEVCKIQDALSLWESLKASSKVTEFHADVMEEYEDEFGNVYNKKTFEDLKKQGII